MAVDLHLENKKIIPSVASLFYCLHPNTFNCVTGDFYGVHCQDCVDSNSLSVLQPFGLLSTKNNSGGSAELGRKEREFGSLNNES